MTINALLIDLDPLYSESLPTPPPIISSAKPVTFHPDKHTDPEVTRLRRQLERAHDEIETLHDELREAVAALRDERAETARLDRARRWEIGIRETKEKELAELKKRMAITRADHNTKEAEDPSGSEGDESQSQRCADAECKGEMTPPIPATTTRDIGLNTDSPNQATRPILDWDSQAGKPALQRHDTCDPSQSQSSEIPGSPTPTSPDATALGSPATFSSFFAKALADVSRDSSIASPLALVKPNMSGNSGTSTPTTQDPARAQTMVLLNQVRSEKRALEMRVNELIARNTSLATEKSTIQKRLEETQNARLALERKLNSLQSGGQPAKEATPLPTKPDPSVSILPDLQSRYSAMEKRLKSSQSQIAGLERHLREWKTKANELESKLRAAQKGPAKIDTAAKATVAGTVELNALRDKLAASKKELEGLKAKFEAQGQLLAEARKREAVERQKVELLEEELRVALKG